MLHKLGRNCLSRDQVRDLWNPDRKATRLYMSYRLLLGRYSSPCIESMPFSLARNVGHSSYEEPREDALRLAPSRLARFRVPTERRTQRSYKASCLAFPSPISIYIHMYVHTCVHRYIYMYVHLYIYMYVHIHAYTHVHILGSCTDKHGASSKNSSSSGGSPQIGASLCVHGTRWDATASSNKEPDSEPLILNPPNCRVPFKNPLETQRFLNQVQITVQRVG